MLLYRQHLLTSLRILLQTNSLLEELKFLIQMNTGWNYSIGSILISWNCGWRFLLAFREF